MRKERRRGWKQCTWSSYLEGKQNKTILSKSYCTHKAMGRDPAAVRTGTHPFQAQCIISSHSPQFPGSSEISPSHSAWQPGQLTPHQVEKLRHTAPTAETWWEAATGQWGIQFRKPAKGCVYTLSCFQGLPASSLYISFAAFCQVRWKTLGSVIQAQVCGGVITKASLDRRIAFFYSSHATTH